MNGLLNISTTKVAMRDKPLDRPSLGLQAGRLLCKVCVTSLDLLCLARLMPSPTHRVCYERWNKPAEVDRSGAREDTRDRFEYECREVYREDVREKSRNRREVDDVPTSSGSDRSGAIARNTLPATNKHKEEPSNPLGIQLQASKKLTAEEHKFMMEYLYRNASVVEIMTTTEFVEYCRNLMIKGQIEDNSCGDSAGINK